MLVNSLGAFGAAALFSALGVRLSIRVARQLDFMDSPDSGRKQQVQPIPKLGGVAVAVAVSVATLLGLAVLDLFPLVPVALGVLLPALGAALVGLADDRSHLNPYLRLTAQAGLASAAWLVGVRVAISGVPFLDYTLFIVWVLTVVNGVNLIDNSDGLAASTTFVSAIGAGVAALIFGQQLVSILGFAVAGASAGFLLFNWHPARVYLGDSGAYFLGFLLSVLVVEVSPVGVPALTGLSIAILLALLPIADLSFVVLQRLRSGVHPFTAGRDHLSHNLISRGFRVPQTVLLLQLVSISGALGAVSICLIATM